MDWKSIINDDWTLFLDRDGVINVRIIDGYVTKTEEFEFLPNVIEAFKIFKNKFKRIIVVTNQQGVGKGVMTIEDVISVHNYMNQQIFGIPNSSHLTPIQDVYHMQLVCFPH